MLLKFLESMSKIICSEIKDGRNSERDVKGRGLYLIVDDVT